MFEFLKKKKTEPVQVASELNDRLGELTERVEELETRLRDIGDIAHAQSTGPAEPDWLWSIRELAYELL